ncbi:TRAP transporter small permease [Rubrimonas cliftonensis]|uniref:TRAP transporter small permease protein n=1 Tax=Rubrimonas cliftonensis TaxID=89524 RepID=A0A1H4FKG7_9RHOB|nr:TRAP transporter small permease [Rubrimonas cliftonensis]SEA97863.1 TRAP-type C4-dicarboxylate transport system, small permease component [Rubrimonas cliftonensis]
MAGKLARALEVAAATLLLALMAVTIIDVVGRYLLEAPLVGAFELTELLLCAMVFAALPLASRDGGHVEVDLLAGALPRGAAEALARAAAAISAAVLLYFAWRLVIVAHDLIGTGARSNALVIPFAPFAAFGALACVLAAGFGVLREWRR